MNTLNKPVKNDSLLCLASFLLATSILLGAVAAHALKNTLEPTLLNTFQVGVHYQQLQSLGLLILGLFLYFKPSQRPAMKIAIILHVTGMLLFSGNCYLYALTQFKFFVHLVPVGGIMMIVAWFKTAFSWTSTTEGN